MEAPKKSKGRKNKTRNKKSNIRSSPETELCSELKKIIQLNSEPPGNFSSTGQREKDSSIKAKSEKKHISEDEPRLNLSSTGQGEKDSSSKVKSQNELISEDEPRGSRSSTGQGETIPPRKVKSQREPIFEGAPNLRNIRSDCKIFLCLDGPGKKVLEAVFRTMYCHPAFKSDEGKATLQNWFKNNMKSKKNLKALYGRGSDEYRNNEAYPLKHSYPDLSFYFISICQVNSSFYENYLDNSCHKNILYLKKLRDELSHIGTTYSRDSELSHTLNKLTNSCVQLLKSVSKALNNNYYTQPLLEKIPKEIIAIRIHNEDTRLTVESIENMIESNMTSLFIRHSQIDLSAQQIEREFTNPFYWLREKGLDSQSNWSLDEVFTMPWLLCGNKKLDPAHLFTTTDANNDQPRVLLVCGHGGSGKTTLAHKIYTEWQNKQNKHPTFQKLFHIDLAFLIEMRYITQSTLVKYVSNTLRRAVPKYCPVENLMNLIESMSVLFIIDGFDEKNAESTNLVIDIAKKLRSARVFITTRYEYISEVVEIFSKSSVMKIDIKGFDADARKNFSRKMFLHSDEDSQKFTYFLDTRARILTEHLNYPLTMALLVLLYKFKGHNAFDNITIESGTQLYVVLFDMLQTKLCEARDKMDRISSETVGELLHSLSGKALAQLNSEICRLKLSRPNSKYIQELCREKSVPVAEFMSAFMECESRRYDTIITCSYTFIHKTEIEFLSAMFISKEDVLNHNFPLIEYFSSRDMKNYVELLPFLTGCLSRNEGVDQHSEEIVQLVKMTGVKQDDYNFIYKLLSEMEGSHKIKSLNCVNNLCNKMSDFQANYNWILKVETVLSGLRLLTHYYNNDIKRLEIDLSQDANPDSDERISTLGTELKEFSFNMKRQKRYQDSKVDLAFNLRQHYHGQDAELSDPYLKYLSSWSNLVEFVGSIGDDGVKSLFSCRNMKLLTIKIRSPEVFNKFLDSYRQFDKLKKLRLSLDLPSSVDVVSLKTIPDKQRAPEIRLEFYNLSRKTLPFTLRIVQQIAVR